LGKIVFFGGEKETQGVGREILKKEPVVGKRIFLAI
jgi:hypothetical protein